MLNDLRLELNSIDDEIIKLLEKRFEITDAVGAYKKKENMQILQPERETEIIEKIKRKLSGSQYAEYIIEIYIKLFEESRKQQAKYLVD